MSEITEAARIFDLTCDLSGDERARALEEMNLPAAVRAEVDRLLVLYDEPESQLDRIDTDQLVALAGDKGRRIGPYRLGQRLGEGGMGVVWLAQRDDSRELVALKVLRWSLDSGHLKNRFRREAEVLRRLDHPGICRFLEAGEDRPVGAAAPQPYLAMEYVAGEQLLDHARKYGLDDRQRVELVARICDALHHAHEAGVIHRDLKPSNVLVVPESVDGGGSTTDGLGDSEIGQPKVLDFGVARAASGDLVELVTVTGTQSGALVGTLIYMSPEQVAARPGEIDARSDVYSLGVLLFELLTHRLPYPVTGLPVPLIARMIQEDDPTRLGSALERLRGPLENVVAQALEKDKRRRYRSAAAFADDLRRFVRGEPVRARPPTFAYQVLKFARRHRALTAALFAVFLALSIGLAAAIWFGLGEASARRLADANARAAERGTHQASMRAAVLAIEIGDVIAARNELGRVPKERRGWEWRHLDSAIDESSTDVHTVGDWPGVGFSADSDRIELWNDGESLTIEIATGRVVEEHRFEGPIRGPSARLGARLTDDGSLRLETPAGKPVQTYALPAGAQSLVALVGDPAVAIVEYPEGRRLFDTVTESGRRLAGDGFWDWAVLSPSRRYLAVPDEGGFRLWDLETNGVPWVYGGGRWGKRGVVFSPDEREIAFADSDGTVSCWSLTPGQEPSLRFQSSHDGSVNRVAYSPDGRWIASAGAGAVIVFSTVSGKRVRSLAGHSWAVKALNFSADSQRLATVDSAGFLRVWDLGRDDPRVLRSGSTYLYATAFDPSGERVYVGTPTGLILVYDARTSNEFARIPLTISDGEPSAVFHVNHLGVDAATDSIIASAQSGHVVVLDRMTGAVEHEIQLESCRHFDVAPASGRLATASDDGSLAVFDTSTGTLVGRRMVDASGLGSVRFGPDGESLFAAAYGGSIHALDAASLELRVELEAYPPGRLARMAIDRENRLLASAPESEDGFATVFDLETLEVVAQLDSLPFSIVFSPDGQRLIAGTYDADVQVWDTESWDCLAVFRGHIDYVADLDFSPDGETLFTAGGDGTARFFGTRPLRAIHAEQDAYERSAAKVEPLVARWQGASADEAVRALLTEPGLDDREREIALQLLLRQLHAPR